MNDIIYRQPRPAPYLITGSRIESGMTNTVQPTIRPRVYAKPARPQPAKKIPAWLQLLLTFPLIIVAAILIRQPVLGQLAIVLYGIVALAWRIPSRSTFTIALLSMAATIALLVVGGDPALAANFATYTFLLLVAGVITLGRELKNEGGRVYSIRHHKS